MSVVDKFKEIKEGWQNLLFQDPEIEKLANQRAAICAACPFNKNNTCGLCGCYLPAKTRSIKSKCPEGKW